MGEDLVRRGVITEEQLAECLDLIETAGREAPPLGDVLVQLGYVDPGRLDRRGEGREAATSARDRPSSRRRSLPAETRNRGRRLEAGESRRTSRPKKTLSPRMRFVQLAIFAAPVVLLAVVVWARFFSGEPVAITEGPGASAPKGPAATDDPGPEPRDQAPRVSWEELESRYGDAVQGLTRRAPTEAEAWRPFEELRRRLDEVLEARPEIVRARLLRGRVRSFLDDPAGAIADFDSILEALPEDATARMERGRERFRLHWREMVRFGAWWDDPALWPDTTIFDAAAEDFEVVLRNGDAAVSQRASVYLALTRGNPGESMQRLGQMPALDAELRFLRGLVRHWSSYSPDLTAFESEQLATAALAEFDRALEQRWHFPDAHVHRALCLVDLGRSDEPVQELSVLLEHRPQDVLANYALGRVYYVLGPREQQAGNLERSRTMDRLALERLETVLRVDPDHAGARVLRGDLLGTMGRDQEAVADFQAALRGNPKCISALQLLAVLLERHGNHLDAARAAGEALRVRPMIWDLHFVRFEALRNLGRTEEARRLLEGALSLNPPPEVRRAFESALKQ